jgi:RNA polymerase sigma-70 factor (ECF subfamily)
MGEAFGVRTREEMLDFFLASCDEVHRYVSRLTGGDVALTEDVVQDVFLALLRHQRDGDDAVMRVSWLITTARHRVIDLARSRQREQARIERHHAGESDCEPPVDAGTVSADHARWLLGQLPLRERVALSLHTVEGMSVAEVAGELGLTVTAATSLLARARRRLRDAMREGIG